MVLACTQATGINSVLAYAVNILQQAGLPGAVANGADVAIKLFGDDLEQLLKSGDAINDVAASIPGAEDVKLEQVTGLPMLSVTPRRDMLARYGISMAEVQDAVATATGGRKAGEVFECAGR